MSTEHQITRKAADGILTFAELAQFVREAGNAAEPSPESFTLTARVGFGGGIKSITVKIPGGE